MYMYGRLTMKETHTMKYELKMARKIYMWYIQDVLRVFISQLQCMRTVGKQLGQ